MSHLPTERLAALVDEAPTAAELAHLSACAACARERVAYSSVADLAGAETARLGTPITSWESLRPALVADGIIDSGRGLQFRARQVRRPWLQAAAAVLLVAGGVMGGRYSAGASPLANSAVDSPVASAPVSSHSADSAQTFKSVEDAVAAQTRAQLLYQNAVAFIAQHDTANDAPASPAAIRTRLAALDETGRVLSQARQKSPYDPVINGYYLTTMGQREATLRQLNTVLPASMQIMSY
ncbi:MAG TPA: hypothetical protein VN706_03750 [Gemmatimonadaceae bacterium]|nr:hypothetical protein [Gemmatimonadaceae bacterium]